MSDPELNNLKEKVAYYETQLRQIIANDGCDNPDGECPEDMTDCAACLVLHILQNAPT